MVSMEELSTQLMFGELVKRTISSMLKKSVLYKMAKYIVEKSPEQIYFGV